MNVFRTLPKFIQGYIEAKRFTKLVPEIKALREAGDIEAEKALINKGQKRWVEETSKKLGISYEIKGYENMPEKSPFMIYSNHQGFADVPAIAWLMKDYGQIGYVAKEEWKKYKVLNDAITYTRSIFLTRDNPKEAVRALSEAKGLLEQGFNLVIFPEGTRSRGHKMGEFKAGAFKFAEKAKVPILPVTLDGSYQLYEQNKSYQPCHIKITVHPLVHIEEMDKEAQKDAQKQIEDTVRSAL